MCPTFDANFYWFKRRVQAFLFLGSPNTPMTTTIQGWISCCSWAPYHVTITRYYRRQHLQQHQKSQHINILSKFCTVLLDSFLHYNQHHRHATLIITIFIEKFHQGLVVLLGSFLHRRLQELLTLLPSMWTTHGGEVNYKG